MSTLLIASLSVVVGMAATIGLARRRFRLHDQTDPFALLKRPTTRNLADFSAAVREQLHEWATSDVRASRNAPQNVRQVLGCLSMYSDGTAVWSVRNGTLTVQDGTTTPIAAFAAALERELIATGNPLSSRSLPSLLSATTRETHVVQFTDEWIVQRFVRRARSGEDEDLYEPWPRYDTGNKKEAALLLDDCQRRWPEHEFRVHRVRLHEKLATEAIARARAANRQ